MTDEFKNYDVCIVGAGAAGLFCSFQLAKRGFKTLLLEHNSSAGRKILISGGGRCNFTNLHSQPSDFKSSNSHFVKSALSRFSPEDFISFVKKHNIAFYEKKLGQLFCRESSKQILNFLLEEVNAAGVDVVYDAKLLEVKKENEVFSVYNKGQHKFKAKALVVATGGLSIPKIGASSWGYNVAKQFGHTIIPTRSALVSFRVKEFSLLSGVSCVATLCTDKHQVSEDLLFTHNGLSGPAALKASLYWNDGEKLVVDFLPDFDLASFLENQKNASPQFKVSKILKAMLPQRLIEFLILRSKLPNHKSLAELSKKELLAFVTCVKNYECFPSGLDGYQKAEVTDGGVSTSELSSKNMGSLIEKNLYFIGEVVDVTGQLGGFNFQWAWASAFAMASEFKLRENCD